MMPLSLMVRFFDTVDGEWHSPLAEQIAALWPLAEPDVRVFRASANFVCAVTDRQGKYYLRFNHDDERQPRAITAELAYIDHITRHGVRAARPIPSRANRLVESLETPLGEFHAVLFEALPGQHREFDQLDLAGFAHWGRSLAEIHRAGQGFQAAERPGWRDWLALTRTIVPASDALIRRALGNVESALNGLPTGEDVYGMIHYDFEQDNLCWQDDTVGVLDFDDCGLSWYAADIAFALRDLFHDRCAAVNPGDERFRAFLKGYCQVREISAANLAPLLLFLRLHNLVAFARITRALADGPRVGEPAWAADLRARLESQLASYRADFETLPAEYLADYALSKDRWDEWDEHENNPA